MTSAPSTEYISNQIATQLKSEMSFLTLRNTQFYSEKLFKLRKLTEEGDDPAAIFQLAKTYFMQRHFLRCAGLILETKMDRHSCQFSVLLTAAMLECNDYEKVVEYLDTPLKFESNEPYPSSLDSLLHLNKAKAYANLESRPKAKESAILALKLDPNNFEAFFFLHEERLASPTELLSVISGLNSNNQEWLIELYTRKIGVEAKFEPALISVEGKEVSLLDELIRVGDSDSLLMKAEELINRQNNAEADNLLSFMFIQDPYNTEIYPIYCDVLKKNGKTDQLALVSGKIAECFPDSMEHFYSLGSLNYSKKNFDEASKNYTIALHKAKDNPWADLSKAECHSLMMESEGALEGYKEYNLKHPGCFKGFLALGTELMLNSSSEYAHSMLEHAYELNPNSPEVNTALASLFKRKNEFSCN